MSSAVLATLSYANLQTATNLSFTLCFRSNIIILSNINPPTVAAFPKMRNSELILVTTLTRPTRRIPMVRPRSPCALDPCVKEANATAPIIPPNHCGRRGTLPPQKEPTNAIANST